MSDYYILVGTTPVQIDDLRDWATWYEKQDRRVAKDTVGDVEISTVFLGLDHAWGESLPMIFETMVFGGELDQEQVRYSTWEQAEVGHRAMVKRVREAGR
jgi:hypothetical protein